MDILTQHFKKAAYHPDLRLKASTFSSFNNLILLYIKKFCQIVYLSICIGAKLAEQMGDGRHNNITCVMIFTNTVGDLLHSQHVVQTIK
jgi:hypothetical protein